MKVKAHGVEGNILTWISNWLRNREQRVVINGQSSQWMRVLSGVPQGFVLGPLLFVLYINDTDSSVCNKLLKFADDAKLVGRASTQEEVDSITRDLSNLVKWSKDWMMLFNTEKCKVVHFGRNNQNCEYSLNSVNIKSVNEERDLGVIIQSNLKVSSQCVKAVKTGNKILGMIKRSFVTRDKDIILGLYKALVRPHLEFCVQAWRPHLAKDIALLEGVQRRATMIIDGFHGLSYDSRLKALGITTLETRRLRGDLIEVFKIMKGFEDIPAEQFFTLNANGMRGHKYKLYKERFRTDIGKYTFSSRVVEAWNKLPDDVVSCTTVTCFKVKLNHIIRINWGLI
jgi:hypothetical protein